MQAIQLSIPQPCHEDWNNMTPTQQGRFCQACAKEVVDFSSMSDQQVLNYFTRKAAGEREVCGRVWPDQLNRSIAATPTGKQRWWMRYAAMAMLLLRLTDTKAQGGLKRPLPVGMTQTASPSKWARLTHVTGRVQDEHGQPVPFASVQWQQKGVGVMADATGQFSVEFFSADTLEISSLGFTAASLLVTEAGDQVITLRAAPVALKEVVVPSTGITGRLRMGGLSIRACSIEKRQKDSLLTKLWQRIVPPFTISPNPVQKGAVINVTASVSQKGIYTAQVVDAAGRVLLQQQVQVPGRKLQQAISIPQQWAAGTCFVRMIDPSGKPVGTESFVIQ